MNLFQNLRSIVADLLPTNTRIIVRGRQQEPALAHTLSVDDLAGILRNAEAGDPSRLFALYRDIMASHSHLQGEHSKRKLAVLGQPLKLSPADRKDAAQTAHCERITAMLTDQDFWIPTVSHLLDSTLYPVSLCERWYRPSNIPGWRWEIDGMRPVPHNHLVWPDGVLSLKDTDRDGNFPGTRHAVDWRRYFLHRGHLLTSVPDWWGGPMRSLVFWWLFSVMGRDWWIRFLDRFGSPFLEGRYDPADERGRYELEAAFSAATKLFGIVVSNDTEVKMHQASLNNADAFEAFHAVANREISKLILGQTLSAEGQNLGLGGGQAAAQSEVREDIRLWDAAAIAQTLRVKVLKPLWQVNGWTMPLPVISWGSLGADEGEVNGQTLAALASAGLRPTDAALDTIGGRLGYPIERAPAGIPAQSFALSASAPEFPPLVPGVARRAARSRQARAAVDALARQSSPKLARLMQSRASDYLAALEASTSPDDAAARFAALSASYDPAAASELIDRVLTSAAVNAVIRAD